MVRVKESAVWRYFTLATPTSSTAICNICKVNVSRGGGSAAEYNTANLIKHNQKPRAKEHAKFLQLNKTKGAGDRTDQQITLADALQRREKVSDAKFESIGDNTESFRIHCFRCSTNVVVEEEGFCRRLEYLEPRYSLPSRKYFSKTGKQFIINSTTVLGIDRYTKPRHRHRDWKCRLGASLVSEELTVQTYCTTLLHIDCCDSSPPLNDRQSAGCLLNSSAFHTLLMSTLNRLISQVSAPTKTSHGLLGDGGKGADSVVELRFLCRVPEIVCRSFPRSLSKCQAWNVHPAQTWQQDRLLKTLGDDTWP